MAQQLEDDRDFKIDWTAAAGGSDSARGRSARCPLRTRRRILERQTPPRGIGRSGVNGAALLYARRALSGQSDQKVQIIDEFTGRVLADRSWRHGLHQAIEIKEAVPVTADKENLARLSFQRFFRQYPVMAGMTGTAWEIARRNVADLSPGRWCAFPPTSRASEYICRCACLTRWTRNGKRSWRESAKFMKPALRCWSARAACLASEECEPASGGGGQGASRPERHANRPGSVDHRRGRPDRKDHDRDEHGRPRHRYQAGPQA